MRLQQLQPALTLVTVTTIFTAIHNVDASVISNPTHHNNSNVDTLSWGSCGEGIPSPLECAKFPVPLDWADESKGKIQLAVIRLPHDKTKPCGGYMFYNPGGPGDSGVDLVIDSGNTLQAQIGRSWDVVSWDPRGIGRSEPNLTLFDTELDRVKFWAQIEGPGNLDAHGNLTTQPDIDFFMSKAPDFDALLKSYNEKYIEKYGDMLQYVGTAAVVRDLVALTEAIYGEGADVNFHGFSYGTVIGAYLTQMFPDRVGKVIIDGVAEPFGWANLAPMTTLPTNYDTAEKSLEGWAAYCAAAPEKCDMAKAAATVGNVTGNVTASDIVALIDQIFNTAYQTYDGTVWLDTDLPASPTGFTYSELGQIVSGGMYHTPGWKELDSFLVAILSAQLNVTSADSSTGNSNNTTTSKRSELLANVRKSRGPIGFDLRGSLVPDPVFAVACGDAIDSVSGAANTTTEEMFKIIVDIANTLSPHFASDFVPQTGCSRWTFRAVERLPVPFTTKPKNVILVIGNSADVITPYSSAQKVASEAHLGHMARLVKLNAVGHTSSSQNSTCLNNLIHSFVRGEIPADAGNDGPDVECEIDGNPFDSL